MRRRRADDQHDANKIPESSQCIDIDHDHDHDHDHDNIIANIANIQIDSLTHAPRALRKRPFILSAGAVAVVILVVLLVLPICTTTSHLLQIQDQASGSISSSSISSTTSSSSSSKNKKPVFILHVGPPKTGSTTLQCTLESLRAELVQDGIAYIGRPECGGNSNDNGNGNGNIHIDAQTKKEFRLFESALVIGYSCQKELIAMEEKEKVEVDILKKHNNDQNTNTNSNSTVTYPACWDKFIHRLESYRYRKSTSTSTQTIHSSDTHTHNTHVIFSDEAMSNRIARTQSYRPSLPYPFQSLKKMLEGMGWNVKILIVHRPLYDYLPSVYVEQYKDGPGKRRLRRWFGVDNDNSSTSGVLVNVTSSSSCPLQGGRAVPRLFKGIPEYDNKNNNGITISNLLQKDQNLYPTPAQVYEIFRQHGFMTVLVDMQKIYTYTQLYKYKNPTFAAIENKIGSESTIHGGEEKLHENGNGNGNAGQEKDINFIQHIICNIFPETVHTCKALLRRDDDNGNGNDNDSNGGSISSSSSSGNNSSSEKQAVTDFNKNKLLTTKLKLNPSLSLHYDFVAVEACQRSLFHGNTTGRDVARRAIQQRQEVELGLSPNDFPLLCPEERALKEILEMSLEHEDRLHLQAAVGDGGGGSGKHAGSTGATTTTSRRIKSDNSSIGTGTGDIENDESRRSRRRSHEDMFWKVVHEKKKFCTVDSRRVVQDQDWIAFFSSMND